MTEHAASCQCGQLRVRAENDPDFVIVCNCKACQRRSGSPFGAGGYFRKSDVTVSGQSQSWTRRADSGRQLVYHFCPDCGTNLYWSLDMRPDHLGVAAGCFEAELPEPDRVIWTDMAQGWVTFPDHWPSHPQGTPEK